MKINERGFWENETAEGHAHDSGLGKGIADFLQENNYYDNGLTLSVWDLGCGDGYYSYVINERYGLVSLGVDGNPNTRKFSKYDGIFITEDLSVPITLFPSDWVISLEVGEHIPAEYEDIFIDNLHKLNIYGMIISWAVPGQGGDGHVNCKTNQEIISKVCNLGYTYDEEATKRLRSAAANYPKDGYWFKDTLMVFRKVK